MEGICEICRQDLLENDQLYICPNCSQDFHFEHMQIWLRDNKGCPVCKFTLSQQDINAVDKTDRALTSWNPKILGYNLSNMYKETYKDALMEIQSFEDVYKFAEGDSTLFYTKHLEPVNIKISNSAMLITQPMVPFRYRIMIYNRWNFILGTILYLISKAFFQIIDGDFSGILPLLFIIPLGLMYWSKNENYFRKLANRTYRTDKSFHTILGTNMKTDFSKYYVKTINTKDILMVRRYTQNKSSFPCLILERQVPVVLGNNYTVLSDEVMENYLNYIADFLDLTVESNVQPINLWKRILVTDGKAMIDDPPVYWERMKNIWFLWISPIFFVGPLIFLSSYLSRTVSTIFLELSSLFSSVFVVSWVMGLLKR